MTVSSDHATAGELAAAKSLVKKLDGLAVELDSYEAENYKLLLALAAGKLARIGSDPRHLGGAALSAVLAAIGFMKRADVIWRGRPFFLDEPMLEALRQEARGARQNAHRNDYYWMEHGGPVARQLAAHPEFLRLLGDESGVEPAGCMYVFYLTPGDRVDPHVDEYEHSINAILMIEHSYVESPSHLLLFHPDQSVERVALASGEMVVIDGSGLVHAREPVKEGETIAILTVGFKPRAS